MNDQDVELQCIDSDRTQTDDEDESQIHSPLTANNFRPFCFGYCLRGPKLEGWDVQLLVGIIFVVIFVAFAFIGGFMLFDYYPYLVMMPLSFVFVDFVCFLLTGCSDPGIVPPRNEVYIPRNSAERYCKICNIPQEFGCRHCVYCNACILQVDHHCGVVGTCIGARNRVHFSFLFFFYAMSVFTLIISLVFVGLCTNASHSPTFNGTFSQGIDASATIIGYTELGIFAFALISYVLLVFSCFGKSKSSCIIQFYQIMCRNPLASKGLVTVDTETEPLCCDRSPCGDLFPYPVSKYRRSEN